MSSRAPTRHREVDYFASRYEPERVWALIHTWGELRSELEREGELDRVEWAEVIDVERGLHAMAWPHLNGRREPLELREHQSASAAVALKMLLGWDNYEIRRVLRRGPEMSPDRLLRKACAWVSVYLSGGTFEEADDAFRETS